MVLLCIAALGCGARPAVKPGQATIPVEIVREHELSLAAVSRPTPGVVHLSLWIDAGSRDSFVPQLATAAAWIAAARGGPRLRALVTPDGTEISRQCAAGRIKYCLARLAAALSTRAASRDEVRQTRFRLAAARGRAEATDPGREADRLALQALLGSAVDGLFPLGEARHDREVTARVLRDFYRRHYGRNRALLVAAGDVDRDSLRKAARRAFEQAPAALARRENRSFKPKDGRLVVVTGLKNQLALAAAVADLDIASAYARALGRGQDRGPEQGGPPIWSRAFSLRGGAFLLVRLPAERPAAALRRTAFELVRLQQEGAPEPLPVLSREGLPEIARATGESWCVETQQRPGNGMAIAAGALVAARRRDGTGGNDRAGGDLDRTRDRLQKALSEAYRLARPRLRGSMTEQGASVLAPNDARIEIRKRAVGTVAVALRFRGGAGSDPFALHGRAALLAEAASSACRGIPAEALRERLQQIDATLQPVVDAASWGVVLAAPGRSWARALDIALECALFPSTDTRDLARARLGLAGRLGPVGSFAWSQGRAARLIAPGAPGVVAPRGTVETAASVSDRELRAFTEQSIGAARLSIGAVGDLPVEEAARRIARRVGLLRKGEPPPTPVSIAAATGEPLQGGRYSGTGIRAIAAWRADKAGAAAALAFAFLVRAELGLSSGIEAVDHGGGSHGNVSWAWVCAKVSEEALDGLENAAQQAARRVSARRLALLTERIIESRRAELSAAGARPEIEADRLALAGIRDEQMPASAEQSRAAAIALQKARPLFFIARPR